jgi:Short C-terminal domain
VLDSLFRWEYFNHLIKIEGTAMSDFGKLLKSKDGTVGYKRLSAEWVTDSEFLIIYKLSGISRSRIGEKKVRLEDITSYQFNLPFSSSWGNFVGGVGYGFIEINYPGSGDLDAKSFRAGYDERENVLPFLTAKQDAEDAKKFYNELAQRVDAARKSLRTGLQPNGSNLADELKKLVELKNAGVLTEEEFNAAKIKILA